MRVRLNPAAFRVERRPEMSARRNGAHTLIKYDARLALLLTHTLGRPSIARSLSSATGFLAYCTTQSPCCRLTCTNVVNLDSCISLTLQPCSLVRPVVRGEI